MTGTETRGGIPPRIRKLDAFTLKCIALAAMTLDHMGLYQTLTRSRVVNEEILRSIGRIAAPLFLFLTAESLRHTRSKGRYALRLYLAGVIVGLVNLAIERAAGCFAFGNILPTLAYTALAVLCVERIRDPGGDRRARLLGVCGRCSALSISSLWGISG